MPGKGELRTHCKRGHALTPDNVYAYTTRTGVVQRRCRLCYLASNNGRAQRYRDLHREQYNNYITSWRRAHQAEYSKYIKDYHQRRKGGDNARSITST